MSFPAYPGYKHSGVELLGEFPDHWTLKRFKNVFGEGLNGVQMELRSFCQSPRISG